MRVNSEIIGDFEVKSVRLYGESRTRVMNALLKVEVDEDQAAEEMGADFHHVAFAGLRVVDGLAKHAAGVISKPHIICEQHEITIASCKFKIMPEVTKIVTVEGAASVIAEITLPIIIDNERGAAYGELVLYSGETVRTHWKSIQIPLPLGESAAADVRDNVTKMRQKVTTTPGA